MSAPAHDGFSFRLGEGLRNLEYVNLFKESGRVSKVLGPIVEGSLPGASVGGICRIFTAGRERPLEAEIVGFKGRTAMMMPFDFTDGVNMGARIEQLAGAATLRLGPNMVGRLLNGKGIPVAWADEQLNLDEFFHQCNEKRPIKAPALAPSERASITQRLETGVRSMDMCTPLGLGQRIAIMAASGVGKSVLMGMIARMSSADVNVIALIGERGREVTEFLERDLGPEGRKRSVVVSVTSDESPVMRVRGAYVAATIAEYFRDQGKNVLFMMDSVTRFGMALREIGLAAGEPPTTKGYTPSVFNQLPRLLERSGARRAGGSITGVFTVLVEGNDFDDPIADAVRSIVDGHIVLSRQLAAKSHYPAIDVLESVSRLSHVVGKGRDGELNSHVRQVLATYRDAEDLINIGGYRKGNNPEWDRAIALYPQVISFLKQGTQEQSSVDAARDRLEEIFRG